MAALSPAAPTRLIDPTRVWWFRAMRFTELQARIGGVSKKMLSKTLRRLEGAGLVSHPGRGGEYALTEVGASLLGPIGALVEWAETHTDEVLDHMVELEAQ